MSVRVTDHAVLRYLERVLGVDVERLRQKMASSCERHQGAPCVKVDGARMLIRNETVITTLSDDTVPHFDMLVDLGRNNLQRLK